MLETFQTYEDVKDWLEPMGYGTFMDAMLEIGLFGPDERDHCDQTLTDGIADMQTVCDVMKFIAVVELKEQWNLPFRHEVMRRRGSMLRPVH